MLLNIGLLKDLSPRARQTHLAEMLGAGLMGLVWGYLLLLPGYSQSILGAGPFAVGVIRVVENATHLVAFVWAMQIQRNPKTGFLAWPRVFGAGFLVIIALYPTVPVLIFCLFFYWILYNGPQPALNAIYKENYPASHRFQLVANIRIISSLCLALTGYVVGTYLEDTGDPLFRFQQITFVVAILSVLGGLAYLRIRVKSDKIMRRQRETAIISVTPEGPQMRFSLFSKANFKKHFSLHGLSKIITDPVFRRYQIAYMFFGLSSHVSKPVIDIYLRRELEVSNQEIGIIYNTIPFLVMALTMRWFGRWLDKVDLFTGRSICSLIWCLAPFILFLSILIPEHAMALVYASRVVVGLGMSGSGLLWTLSATQFARSPEESAEYQGVHITFTGIRGFIGPILGVVLIESALMGYAGIFLLATFGILTSAAITWDLRKKRDHLPD
jgi:hypothetical protein